MCRSCVTERAAGGAGVQGRRWKLAAEGQGAVRHGDTAGHTALLCCREEGRHFGAKQYHPCPPHKADCTDLKIYRTSEGLSC